MSAPRRVIPGASYLASRRCSERRFFLRPEETVNAIFLYCLAYAATVHGIIIHGFMVVSNHLHIDFTDPNGTIPRFMEHLDGLLARALNAFRGRWESFFAPGSYSAVRTVSSEDSIGKLVYTLTNPVEAGLVSHSKKWTGASSRRWSFGETRTFTRPRTSFFAHSCLPAKVTLTLIAPPGLDHLPGEDADRVLEERIIERETEIRAEFRSEGREFLGMDEVMRIDPNDSPTMWERRRGLNPQIAARDVVERIEAIEELQEFRSAYLVAWMTWKSGDHSVVFPAGTYLMRVRHRVSCRPPPPD